MLAVYCERLTFVHSTTHDLSLQWFGTLERNTANSHKAQDSRRSRCSENSARGHLGSPTTYELGDSESPSPHVLVLDPCNHRVQAAPEIPLLYHPLFASKDIATMVQDIPGAGRESRPPRQGSTLHVRKVPRGSFLFLSNTPRAP